MEFYAWNLLEKFLNEPGSIYLQVLCEYFKFSCFSQHLRLSAKIKLQNIENEFCFGMNMFEFKNQVCGNVSNIE